jgi:adhesin transport system membrane fusion protein
MLIMVGGLFWTFFTKLDEVTVTQGTVVPKGNLKVIQHLEGGIIKSIFVKEGDKFMVDQPQLQIDIASSGLCQEELQVRLYSQMAQKTRLEAEASGNDPVFASEVQKYRQNPEYCQPTAKNIWPASANWAPP